MASKLRRILFGTVLALLVAAVPAAFLYYFLPHHDVLRIVGTDTRRPIGSTKSDVSTHMEFFVNTEDIETQQPRVFHNEDTRWGFPWYFKFNSAELQAVAQSLANERGTALITYYGMRIKILSIVPNLTNIKRAAPDEVPPLPWFDFGIATIFMAAIAYLLGLWYRGDWKRRRSVRS